MTLNFSREHVMDVLFPLALLLAFVASAVMVLLLAADVYQDSTAQSARAHTARTVTAYLAEKIHQNDNGGVSMGTLGDCDALVLERPGEGSGYRTYIYFYDGALRELLAREDLAADPEQGRIIMKLQNFSGREVAENLFYFTCTDEDQTAASVYVAVQGEG